MKNSENDQIYAYVITLMKMFEEFKTKFKDGYKEDVKWKNLINMIKILNKRRQKDDHEKIEVNFALKKRLLYHVKDRKRLCIFSNCEINVFQLAHDKNNHFKHNKVYAKLVDQVYISKLSRKIRQYIKHCSTCELNQIKRHFFYEELVSMNENISFRTLTMNFISAFSNDMNTALIVTCKAFKKMTIIVEKFTWTVVNWAKTLLERLLIANWDISESIISNKDFKFIFEFWRIVFNKLEIKLLMSIVYHSQIDEQSKRTNQIVKIALRFFLTKNSKIDWINVASLIQVSLNNSFNVSIELSLNEITYEFKIRDTLFFLITEKIENISQFKILNLLNQTRMQNRQKVSAASGWIALPLGQTGPIKKALV
jgi:hypothetical protein